MFIEIEDPLHAWLESSVTPSGPGVSNPERPADVLKVTGLQLALLGTQFLIGYLFKKLGPKSGSSMPIPPP